ncbi:hypothetical protein [Acetobacter estunensis]|uniref:hypothetical protein n=1 Tax=Acetobacter estunensis TaxID=104097 RepID=UPI0020C42C1E|nr:hypothetical protein [Acetobacter estunensis]
MILFLSRMSGRTGVTGGFSTRCLLATGLTSVLLLTSAPAQAGSSFQTNQIDGSTTVSGTGETLAQLVSAIQSNTTSINSVTSSVNNAYLLAVGAIQSSLLGTSGGVAVLDSTGAMTSPLSTTIATASDNATIGWNADQTWTVNSGTGTQYANPKIAFNHPWTMGYDSSDNAQTDDYMPPTHLRLGGSQEFDGVPLFVHNVPYSEGNMGIVEGVFLQSENMRGSIAGVGPGGADAVTTYDNYDVVARYTFAGPSSPIFTATGSAVTAPDGQTHIPVFYSWGATFANPLPQAWSDWIKSHPHTRMITNEIGVDPSSHKNATYVGMLTGYAMDDNGLVKTVTTDGWRIFGQASISGASTTNETPGTSSMDGTTPAVDTVWSDFGDPAIMFGAYTKAFDANAVCYMPGPTPHATPGDINDPTGKINNQLRACEGIEYDLWDDDTTGEAGVMHGITVSYSGTTSPAADSFDMALAGGNANMILLEGEWYSMNIGSRSFSSAGYGGPDYAAGSKKVVADFGQSNRPGWDADAASPAYSHNMRMTIWNTRNQDDTSNQNDYNDITTSIGVQVDGHGDVHQLSMDGTVQEHMEFNPASFPNGIALCGYYGCGFAVDIYGTPEFTDNAVMHAGKSLMLEDPNDTLRVYIYGNTDGTTHVLGAAGLTEDALTVDGGLKMNGTITNLNSSYASLPTSGSATGAQIYCTDCYASAGSSAHKGIPVWWNGTAWTDALGITALH